MREIVFLMVLGIWMPGQAMSSESDKGLPTLSAPVAHTFIAVLRYLYNFQDYMPKVALTFTESSQQIYMTPEAALASNLSAARAIDYRWWLSTWDSASQLRIERSRAKTPESQFLTRAAERIRSEVLLVSFISRGHYVILRFIADNRKPSALAFQLANGGWRATKEIDDELPAIAAGVFDSGERTTGR